MPTYGHVLQWIVISMLGVGLVMVNSAAMTVGGDPITADSMLTGRPVIYAVLSLLVMTFVGYIDVRRLSIQHGWTNLIGWMLLIVIVLCGLALVPGVSRSVNGASRGLYLGPRSWNLSFQPSELAKWVMVLAVAWWCASRGEALRKLFGGFAPAVLLIAVVCGLIVVEDLGTAVLIAAVAILLLAAAGARWWHLSLVALAGMGAVVALVVTSDYRWARITAFVNPWADPEGSGYHLIQSLNAIQEGGLTGRGLGNSVFKFGYLPEDTTDFLFAVICGELGIVGAMLVAGLYVGLLAVGYAVIRECTHLFGRLLALGILLTIGLQAVINTAVVTGLIPTKGIALPLMSNGGTGWVLTSAAIGILIAIDRINHIEARSEDAPSPVESGIRLHDARCA